MYITLTICIFLILLIISIKDIRSFLIPQAGINSLYLISTVNIIYISELSFNIFFYTILIRFIGCILIYISIKIIEKIAKRVLKTSAIGNGDIKLIASSAFLLGLEGSFLCIVIAFLLGSLFSLIGKMLKKLEPLQAFPFAPFISFSILSVWTLGTSFWQKLWLGLWGL